MSRNITERIDAKGAPVTVEGELLSQIHRRLVPLHMSLASADSVDRDFQSALVHEIMNVLRDIAENSEFQAAHEAERERRRLHPTPEERAARERGEATVERWRRAREERRSSKGP